MTKRPREDVVREYKEKQYETIRQALEILQNDANVRGYLASQPHQWDAHRTRVPVVILQERNKLTQYEWTFSSESSVGITRRYSIAREIIALHNQQQQHIKARKE